MGHAMKAQDAKTRRLRDEGRAEQQQGGRRLAGEYKKITDNAKSDGSPDYEGYCGSHGWAIQQKPDKPEFGDASLPCGTGGKPYDKNNGEGGYGCDEDYWYITKFADAETNEKGVTFDYFVAWGWSRATATGWSADFSPWLAGCMYARYDAGLMVNVDENGNVQEQTIEIPSVGGISCEGCKVDMSAKAELAFFFEMNTDSSVNGDMYQYFEAWTDVDADFDYNIDFRVKNPKVVLPEAWGTPKKITAAPVKIPIPPPYDAQGMIEWIVEPSLNISVKGSFEIEGEASLTSSMDTDAGAWARYLQEEGEFKYGLNGAFEAKGPKLEIVRPFTLSEENHLEIKFKPMFKHTLAINFDDPKDKIEDIEEYTKREMTVGLTLRTDMPVDFGFQEGDECGTSFGFDSLVDLDVFAFPKEGQVLWSSKETVGQVGLGLLNPPL